MEQVGRSSGQQTRLYGESVPSTPVTTEEELKLVDFSNMLTATMLKPEDERRNSGYGGGRCRKGYVGAMKAGVVTNAHAWDAKFVGAYTSAGGFAGEMKTGGVAEVGKVSLIGLDITGSISAVQTFVPVIEIRILPVPSQG